MEEEKRQSEEKTESSTKYDERRKVLTHKSLEEKYTERGHQKIEVIETFHEVGIKKILKDLEGQKEVIKKNIEQLEEAMRQPPEMTPELEKLKENLTKLQLIKHHENSTEESKKKEQDQLDKNKEDLKKVMSHIKEIRDALGSRFSF